MTAQAIDKELAQEAARLDEAKEQATKAAEQLAKDPSNPQLRIAVMQAQQAVAEVQVGIDALNAARVEGEKADTKHADETYRAETLAMFNKAKAMIAKRVAAAKAIDEALTALRTAMASWKDVNAEATRVANGFYKRLYGEYTPALANMEGQVLNAISDGVCEAVGSVSGSHNYFGALNLHVRRVAGVPESAEADTRQMNERHLEALDGFAKAKGVI